MRTDDGRAGEINVIFKKNVRLPFDIKKGIKNILVSEKETESWVNVIFTGDGMIKMINLEYRMKNRETDVIAFESKGEKCACPGGDVFISIDTAKKNAKKYGVTVNEELARLVTHGTLHVLGYDHMNVKDAREMNRKTGRYIRYFVNPESGFRDPESKTKNKKSKKLRSKKK